MASTTNRVMKPSEWGQLDHSTWHSAAKSDPDEVATREGGWMCEKFYRVRRGEKNIS